ncbi:DUF3592 domain-containing protein [Hydrogeniiclostridium mannosilyticum]|mgnify:CR=1 FL=1|nr:DUF3592 domain-containing protein [Hydrogeniiclostridium mannosilyticum]
MKISNWDEAKNQFKTGLPAFFMLAGFVILFVAVPSLFNNLIDYREQLKQVDWIVTDATVRNVEIRTTTGKRSHSRSSYHIVYYEYEVDNQIYTEVFIDSGKSKKIGESFEVKYNPEAPEESTYILEPTLSFIGNSAIFVAVGSALVVFNIILLKKMNKRKQKKAQSPMEE